MEDIPFEMDVLSEVLADSPPPDVFRPVSVSPVEVVSYLPDCLTCHAGRRSPGLVPRWRLAREGPFFAERSSSSLCCFEDGCSFRNTTYRPSDYASPSGEFVVPLRHPRFLEWIGVPESGDWGLGTGEVVTFFVSGPSHGCGYPAASGCLSDDD